MNDQTRKRQAARVRKMMKSPIFRKAYEDVDFLKRDELRPVRLQLELLKPEILMNEQQIVSTIVCFGSTRIRPRPVAQARLRRARAELKRHPSSRKARQQVAIAERLLAKSRFYDEARRFGSLVSRAGQCDGGREFVIITGGGPGIMEAANRGAYDVEAKSIGLGISLPLEQEPNAFISPELNFHFHYFAIRKMHFMLRARAIVAFPGGFGTFDELFEALTLVQTLKVERLPIILFGREYWAGAVDFDYLVAEGVIDPDDARLIQFVESADEAWRIICEFYDLKPSLPKRRAGR